MNYEEFLEYIKEHIGERLFYYEQNKRGAKLEQQTHRILEVRDGKKEISQPEELYEVELHRVMKNNGIILDGLTIRKVGESISPNIYLKPYFDSYQMGKPIANILDEIVLRYDQLKVEADFEVFDIFDFSTVKERLVVRLVNYERNKDLLKNCPYKRFLDLAITFRIIVSKDMVGMASTLVSSEELAAWGINEEALYQIALFNTMREFPWRMDSLAKVLLELLKKTPREDLSQEDLSELREEIEILEQTENGVNMFVLSNESGMNGATCLLYDSVLKNFAKVQDSNIYILPSSVHEVMLVPEGEETDSVFLEQLVSDANRSAVGLIDLLSDHIYYYDREKDKVYIFGEN